MAAGLALTRAKVHTPVGDYERAGVLVRQNVATLRNGARIYESREGVASVTQDDPRHWTVTFGDGTSWSVEKLKGCGCGGNK